MNITPAMPLLSRGTGRRARQPFHRRAAEYLRAQLSRDPAEPGRDAVTTGTFAAISAEIRAGDGGAWNPEEAAPLADLAYDLNELGARIAAHSGLPEAEVRRIIDDAFYSAARLAELEAAGLYDASAPTGGRHAASAGMTPPHGGTSAGAR